MSAAVYDMTLGGLIRKRATVEAAARGLEDVHKMYARLDEIDREISKRVRREYARGKLVDDQLEPSHPMYRR